MGLDIQNGPGQTPIDDDESEGLIPPVRTRDLLNEVEEANISHAIEWTRRIHPPLDEILSRDFLCRVHEKMFGDVWKWAGTFRLSNKNLGVDKTEIATALRNVFDDCRYWIDNTMYEPDEIAIRFKHRVVSIHPFPNGNGRHSRLMADILISKYFKKPYFSWGSGDLTDEGASRRQYLHAIREADKGKFEELLVFARSR
jgi:Fic-DOC domain mobile mystery protein B